MRPALSGVWATIGALVLGAGTASAEKQWLQYRVLDDREQAAVQAMWISCATTKSTLADVALPTFVASDPCLASWSAPLAPQGKVFLALDRSSKKGPYELLYVDSNCNGSLRDKKPIRANSTYDFGSDFPPVKITFPSEDGPITYHVSFHFRATGASQQVYVSSACVYEGSVRIAGKSYHCMLRDCNCNGTFDAVWGSGNSKPDEMRLGEGDKAVTYYVGKYVALDGALYRVKAARDGSCIEFEPAGDVAMGAVRAKNPVAQLSLSGENGLFHLTGGTGSVPAGCYGVYSWKIERSGEDNAKWTLTALGGRGTVEVKPGREAVVDVGEPITCKLGVTSQNGGWQFTETFCARLGENIRIERNDSLAEAPRVRVTNKDGTFSKVYIAEYG